MGNGTVQPVEVRCFSFLKKICDERKWAFPHYFRLDRECSARELAEKLDLPLDLIEAVFINGLAMPMDDGQVKPGDRVGFVPPGTPGPYRALLGMVKGKE
ncbi:MoaD/ThiS family protein [Metallumcola ferriviriculae]|uniref:MoaD/ThiS family protein n=1 Tax=Metallumcola ferriviriculae TaxID=3039180 RepID=A0AAU0UNM8_9FIRM|nr:MoaD/ThiS family protein [Desulfitibacteraceae bacterium MK1]